MYKHLYDKFKNWYHGGSIWFYSDPHFSDEEMKYIRKNYIDDEEQVKRINSKVCKNDTLIILGDIGSIEPVRKLHGYKVLIMGNHDKGASNYKRISQPKQIESERHWDPHFYSIGPNIYRGEYVYTEKIIQEAQDNHLFDEVYEGALFISERILLSHEPIDFPYALNIHGHDHNAQHQKDNTHYNVCAEHIDYTPINLKWIIESGIMKDTPSLHRMTIDEATECRHKKK